MKIIGVTQRIDYLPNRNEVRDGLDQRVSLFLIACGYLPIPIPNSLPDIYSPGVYKFDRLEGWLEKTRPSGIFLSGGNNLGAFDLRDKTEFFLLDYAKINKLPVLGICRGMQIIGTHAGSSLKHVKGHASVKHEIFGEINGAVNSYHNYSLAECPQGFRILSKSIEGEIEAIRALNLNWEGWMWHPEREHEFNSRDLHRIFNIFK